MRSSIVLCATAILIGVLGAPSASSRVATPIPCGLTVGAPWTVTKANGAIRRSNRYYVYETANLSCADVKARVNRLTRMRPTPLLGVSFRASTGERLSCLYVRPSKDIRSLRPATAWGWCGTDVGKVARLGVTSAAGTEFFWVTADRLRSY